MRIRPTHAIGIAISFCVSASCAHVRPASRALEMCDESLDHPVGTTCEHLWLALVTEDPALAARFESFTITDAQLQASTVDVMELRADGSFSVTGGGGPPVARAVMIAPEDLALARRVITARELIELLKTRGPVCGYRALHGAETLRIRAGGETLEKRTTGCHTDALSGARDMMHRLAKHYRSKQ